MMIIDGLALTPYVNGTVKANQLKDERLHFGFVAQWQGFRSSIISIQI
jgi:hypothetical protein